MKRLWTAWILLLAVQASPGIIGQHNWPSPYGADVPFFGERVIFAGLCIVFVWYIYGAFPLTSGRVLGSAVANSALVATLLAAPEPARYAYPAVMAWAQAAMTLQLVMWWRDTIGPRHKRMAAVVAGMQFLMYALFVWSQIGIGLMPVGTASAFYHLHGPAADLAPMLLGTALMLWASRRE